MNQPISNRVAQQLTRLIILGFVVNAMFIGYVFYQDWNGRQALVEAQRDHCERSKLDRVNNANGWRIAEEARRSDNQFDVADRYAYIASSLETRSIIDCTLVFPNARFLP